jgi:hypothetical protein
MNWSSGNVAEKPPEDNTLPGREQRVECAKIHIHPEGDKGGDNSAEHGIISI